jgi:hypothetical protein
MNDEAMHEALRIDGDHIRRVWPGITVAILDLFSRAYAVARPSDSADGTDDALCAIQYDPIYLALPGHERALAHTIIGRGAIRVRAGWMVMRRPNGRPWRARSRGPSWSHTRHRQIGAPSTGNSRAARRGRLSPSEIIEFRKLVHAGLDDRAIATALGISVRGARDRRARLLRAVR